MVRCPNTWSNKSIWSTWEQLLDQISAGFWFWGCYSHHSVFIFTLLPKARPWKWRISGRVLEVAVTCRVATRNILYLSHGAGRRADGRGCGRDKVRGSSPCRHQVISLFSLRIFPCIVLGYYYVGLIVMKIYSQSKYYVIKILCLKSGWGSSVQSRQLFFDWRIRASVEGSRYDNFN